MLNLPTSIKINPTGRIRQLWVGFKPPALQPPAQHTDPTLTNAENITSEKVAFVVEQADKLLTFHLECRDLLLKEAHTTLQWLFGLIGGASAYAAKLVEPQKTAFDQPWTMLLMLILASAFYGWRVVKLYRTALQAEPVLPPGNEPKHWLTDEMLSHDLTMMQLGEAITLQERIEANQRRNARVGDAVNSARGSIALVPLVILVGLSIGHFIAVSPGFRWFLSLV